MRTYGNRSKPKKKVKAKPALKRKIHLPSGVWSWEMRNCEVYIRSPDGSKTFNTDQSEMTGMSWDTLERADWKRWGNSSALEGGKQITPAVVRKWIEDHYLGEE